MTDPDIHAYHNINLSQSKEQRVRAMFTALTRDPGYHGWDTTVLRDVQLVSAGEGRTEFEMTVTAEMCNKAGNLHGGCASTILDNLTSTALLTLARPGFLDGGTVSRTMTLTYLRPVLAGTRVRVTCEAIAGGKRLAHCRGEIRTMDGKACVTCVHDKATVPRAKI